MNIEPFCWCGNRILQPFSPDYLRCVACQTLVAARMPEPRDLQVQEDDRDFYGRHYFDEMAQRHGLPPLSTRARADLPERCIHWLRCLLRYCPPPARVLELGSAHGGFVAMMRWAGFDATGLDLSPEIVAGARRRFDVPMLVGPVESQDIAPGSMDAIVLMDVLEHLGAPKETLRHCLTLLKPDGIIVLQTPQYREGKSFAQMEEDHDPFLRMLTPDQHLYLFSKSSARLLFRQLRVEHVNFEPAIFSAYDMALVASRVPRVALPESNATACLEGSPSGRLVLALDDLNHQFQDLTVRYAESEADRAARLENILKMEKLMAEQASGYPARWAAQLAKTDEMTVRYNDLRNQLRERDGRIVVQAAGLRELEAQIGKRDERIEAQTFELRELTARVAERDRLLATQSGNLQEFALSQETAWQTYSTEIEALTARCQAFSKGTTEVESQKHRLGQAENMLARLHQSRVFLLMRRLHLWGWLDQQALDEQVNVPIEVSVFPSSKTSKGLRKVVVDLTPTLPGGGNGGAKVMTLELIRHLGRIAADAEFILLTSEQSHDELASLDAPNIRRLCVSRPGAIFSASDNLALRARSALVPFLPPALLTKLAAAYRKVSELLPVGGGLVRQLGADLLFCPFTAPFFFDPAVPTVCVVYDLQHAYYPQFFEIAEIEERDRNLRRAVRVASGIVCISEYVRKTVLDKTTALPDRVETIPILLPRRLGTPSPLQSERVLKTFQLVSGRFLLYPANFWPHKNHEVLLTAFGIYLADHPDSDLKLVLTGAPGARQDFLQEAARRMGLSQAVIFPGYLPEEELSALLQSCMALIFPSLFEGFGMPLLEGMAAGRPLLCSNTTSLPEVAGGAALFFDPRVPSEIASAIAHISTDPDLRRELAAKSTQRLADFGGPEEMAASYLRMFRNAVQEPTDPPRGIYGAFGDGWLGERFTISFGTASESRMIRIALAVPEWVSTPILSVDVIANGTAPKQYTIAPGQVVVIESAAGSAAGSIDVLCSPSFQPAVCGFGEDTRSLTCQLRSAEIVGSDNVSRDLKMVSYDS